METVKFLIKKVDEGLSPIDALDYLYEELGIKYLAKY